MLQSILDLKGTQKLNKNQQSSIKGGIGIDFGGGGGRDCDESDACSVCYNPAIYGYSFVDC